MSADFFARPQWYDRAACRGLPPDLFYPERDTPNGQNGQNAAEVCRACPVISECFEYAIKMGEDEFGIWGGLPPKKRRPRMVASSRKLIAQIIEARELAYLTPSARRAKRARKKSSAAKSCITP